VIWMCIIIRRRVVVRVCTLLRCLGLILSRMLCIRLLFCRWLGHGELYADYHLPYGHYSAEKEAECEAPSEKL